MAKSLDEEAALFLNKMGILIPVFIVGAFILVLFTISYLQFRSERLIRETNAKRAVVKIHAGMVRQGDMDPDVAKFLGDSTKYTSVVYRHKNWGYEELIRRLASNFKSVTRLVNSMTAYGEEGPESVMETYELEDQNGVLFFLKLQKQTESLTYTDKDGAEQPRLTATYNLQADKINEDLEVVYSVTTIVPTEICKEVCSTEYLVLMHKCLEASAIEHVSVVREDTGEELTTWHLVSTGIMGLKFQPYMEKPSIVSPTKLNASYNAVHLEFKGDEYEVPMAELVPLLRRQLLGGSNITLFGSTGTGKSALIDNIVTGTDITVVRLNAEVIVLLNSAEAKDRLVDFCKSRQNVIFIYDEVQEAAGNTKDTLKLMSLMEGDLKKMCPCTVAVILALNVEKEKVLPDLIRVGRGGMLIDLGPLSPNKARTLSNLLIEEGKTVDVSALEGTLQAKGNATLAETYGTVITPEVDAIVTKRLQKYRVEKKTDVPIIPLKKDAKRGS